MNTKLALRVYAGYSIIGGLTMIIYRAITQGADPTIAPAIIAERSMGAYIVGLGAMVWLMSEIEEAAFYRGLIVMAALVVLVMLYNIVIAGAGVPPMYLAIIMNTFVIAVSWPKMR